MTCESQTLNRCTCDSLRLAPAHMRMCAQAHSCPARLAPSPSGGSTLTQPLSRWLPRQTNLNHHGTLSLAHTERRRHHTCVPPRPATRTRCIHCSGSCLTPRPGVGGSQPIPQTPLLCHVGLLLLAERFPAHAAALLPTPRLSVPSPLASCCASQMLAFVASQCPTDHCSVA